jgi:glucose/mannose-6-phosphate isomerase
MTSILDSRDQINAIDQSNLLGSVESLADQIQDAWEQTKALVFPSDYPQVKNIIVSGMGGSNLGSLVIKHLFKDELTLPLEVYPHYHLPAYVSAGSLVLLSSYSGDTEETLAAAQQAKSVGAKIAVITGGGELADMARLNNWPMYLIDAKFNPSGQPRMAIGYEVFGQLSMFAKVGLINLSEQNVLDLVDHLRESSQNLAPEAEDSPAKLLAFSAFDKHIIFVGAEHLIGAAHVVNNQVNENAKSLTSEWHLPEFNHHFLEALSFPHLAKETTIFLIFNSALYHKRVQKRVLLTKDLLEQKGFEAHTILATSENKLEQVFEIIQIGEYLALYLSMLYGIDPSPIPSVDWFKSEMAK